MESKQMSDRFATEREKKDLAFANLREVLDRKIYGDTITAEEICVATGFPDWRSFGRRIHTYMRKRGLEVRSVPGDGWRVPAPSEMVSLAPRLAESGRRKILRGYRAAASVPSEKLTDRQERERCIVVGQLGQQVALATNHKRDHKRRLKQLARESADRVPTK